MKDWTGWQPQERAVLVFLRDGDRVLLIHKKRGLGRGKVNGPGGRLEPGETWEQAALRETKEETGLTILRWQAAADLWFQFVQGYALSVRVFVAERWTGTLTACDEADPFWHPLTNLPWNQMWPDDFLWLPPVLQGKGVTARFVFDEEVMKEAEVEIVDRSPGPLNG